MDKRFASSSGNKHFTVNMDEFPPLYDRVTCNAVKVDEINTKGSKIKGKKEGSRKTKAEYDDKNENEETANVTNRTSRRRRRIPKVFIPNGNENEVYCLCQREDTGWYLICTSRLEGCYQYYHPKCVGLSSIKNQEGGENYSNSIDGESYICPLCAKREREKNINIKKIDKVDINADPPDICDDEIDGQCLQMPESDNGSIEGSVNDLKRTSHIQTMSGRDANEDVGKAFMRDDMNIEHMETFGGANFHVEEEPGNCEFSDDFELNSKDYDRIDSTIGSATAANELCISHETMSRMLDCPKLPNTSFFQTDVHKKASFQLSEEDWNRIKPVPSQPTQLQSCWSDVLASHISRSNAFCTFDFQRHFVQKVNSRKRRFPYVFTASGFCIFNDCSCTFELSMKKEDFETKLISVVYNGSVKHAAGERQARFLKGDQRKAMIEKFHKGNDKPSMVYQEKKAGLP